MAEGAEEIPGDRRVSDRRQARATMAASPGSLAVCLRRLASVYRLVWQLRDGERIKGLTGVKPIH